MTLLHPDETSTPLLAPADIQLDQLAKGVRRNRGRTIGRSLQMLVLRRRFPPMRGHA
nr:MAG TPA: hypothetical protein [Caudoviricetes sp.]